MKKNHVLLALMLAAAMIFTACEPDEPEVPNPEEVITTMTVTLTPNGGGDDVVLTFNDPDGDGGTAATITGGTLAANETYAGSIELLNETETPAEDVTEEIAEEDDEHQFFFQSDIAGLAVAYGDTDGDGNPLGLKITVTTVDAGTGTLTVTLRHEPDKNASGVAEGDITNAGGETDIEVDFPVEVQ